MISTMDQLIAAMPGQRSPYFKSLTPQAAGALTSLWTQIGIPASLCRRSAG
jgi:hypothetical protein